MVSDSHVDNSNITDSLVTLDRLINSRPQNDRFGDNIPWVSYREQFAGPSNARFDFIIGIKHGFSFINISQVPWEVLKTGAEGRGFQHLPKGLGEC